MSKKLPLKECSIKDIYCTEQMQYAIPIYQRNYAWGHEEIMNLIEDVNQAQSNKKERYYIGTLVTFKSADNLYEVIDGQQRLTTIYLILRALGVQCASQLTYTARSVSASTLKNLDQREGAVDRGIIEGFRIAKSYLEKLSDNKEAFCKYFCENVRIIHYEVPQDVDLNHYFEVMNSRGEQLEMHEIVKSLLGGFLGSNQKKMSEFYHVWEACSEMGIYIQHKYPNQKVFGRDLDNFVISQFDENISISQDASADKKSIKELMGRSVGRSDKEDNIDRAEQFQPIIDFPNFLLIVLKVTLAKGDWGAKTCGLDDKELLKEFGKVLGWEKVKNNGAEFASQFLFNLLKARYFLDNYIVHHEVDQNEIENHNPWCLQYYCKSKDSYELKNLAGDTPVQQELVHLLSMFEVTFTPRQRKNYLFYAMMFLFEKFPQGSGNKDSLNEEFLDFLRKLADKYFHDVYLNKDALTSKKQPSPDAFDKALMCDGKMSVEINNRRSADNFCGIYQPGSCDVPLYIFNYTDYVLWKFYCDTLRGKKLKSDQQVRQEFFKRLGCSDFGLDVFDKFYFSRTRKSLEHFYPQAKEVEGVVGHESINCFGNFAMISSEANSAGSSWDPINKISHYNDGKWRISVASLKFKIMMQMCIDRKGKGAKAWRVDEIADHQRRMIDILLN